MRRKRQFTRVEKVIVRTPRPLLWLILIGLLVPLVLGLLRFLQGDIDAPPPDQAPCVIQTYLYNNNGADRTPSRYYYGEHYSTINGVPTLRGYWDFDGKEYNYHNEIKSFPPVEYGPVDIIWRPKK